MGCMARCTAKMFVAVFSLLMMAIAVLAIAVGVFSISQFDATFLAGAIPLWASMVMIAVGVLAAIFALGTMCGTVFCLHQSKKGLAILSVFTFLFMALFAASAVVAFRYSALMEMAADKGFADDVHDGVEAFYTGLRDAYVKAYVQCNATAYMTSNIKSACKTASLNPWNELNVSACAADAYDGEVDRVALLCRDGPGLDPFTVDHALAFPPPSSAFDLSEILKLRSLGYFMSAACMPTSSRYFELMAELVALATPGILLPAGVKAKAANSTFGTCYRSKWWGERTDGLDAALKAALSAAPSIPPGFSARPNTGAPLEGQQKLFFEGLQASRAAFLGNPLLSAKLSFCFCADEGSHSKLIVFLREKIFHNVQWICLGLAAFFALVLVAEVYLGCCVRRADLHEAKNPEVTLRGWQAGASTNGRALNGASRKNVQQSNVMIRP